MTAPGQPGSSGRESRPLAAVVALVLGALLSLAYAGWAFTARRGIFADFADGNAVSTDDATSSDHVDTVLIIVAGLVVVIALALWVMRTVNESTTGGLLDAAGLGTAVIGVLIVLVGLFLASGISDGSGQAEQGDKGVTATTVTGIGFLVLAIGLLIGVFAVRGSRKASMGYPPPGQATGYQTW